MSRPGEVESLRADLTLVKAGFVVDSGLTAKTVSGRLATIWRAT